MRIWYLPRGREKYPNAEFKMEEPVEPTEELAEAIAESPNEKADNTVDRIVLAVREMVLSEYLYASDTRPQALNSNKK